jgi:hypothetical protein
MLPLHHRRLEETALENTINPERSAPRVWSESQTEIRLSTKDDTVLHQKLRSYDFNRPSMAMAGVSSKASHHAKEIGTHVENLRQKAVQPMGQSALQHNTTKQKEHIFKVDTNMMKCEDTGTSARSLAAPICGCNFIRLPGNGFGIRFGYIAVSTKDLVPGFVRLGGRKCCAGSTKKFSLLPASLS